MVYVSIPSSLYLTQKPMVFVPVYPISVKFENDKDMQEFREWRANGCVYDVTYTIRRPKYHFHTIYEKFIVRNEITTDCNCICESIAVCFPQPYRILAYHRLGDRFFALMMTDFMRWYDFPVRETTETSYQRCNNNHH